MHVPKDERSKLEAKTKQCVFLGYDQDEFGYRLYDPVEKKLIRSRDVVFAENQTIEDIQNAVKDSSQCDYKLVDVEPVPLQHVPDAISNDIPEQTPSLEEAEEANMPNVPTNGDVGQPEDNISSNADAYRRSSREKRSSNRYPAHEYVLLTDSGEPSCYEETIQDVHKPNWIKAMKDEVQSPHDNHTFELVKLPQGKRALKNK